MAVKEFPTARDNGTVGTIESHLERAFPRGSFYLKNPEGTDAKSNQLTETFRKDWAKYQGTTPEEYKRRASGNNTVQVRGDYQLNTIRSNVAESLGIPPASVVLIKPNGETQNDLNIQLSTFKGYWRKG